MTQNTAKGRLGWKEFLLSLFLIFAAWAGAELFKGNDPASGGGQEGITVMFTTPRYPDAPSQHYGGLDDRLAEALDGAQESVDIAAYDFDLVGVAEALVAAQQRGVAVRLVTDADYEQELGPERLRRAGIPVVSDESAAFMHDKFVIIDGRQVWTGSWNLTDNGTYRNNNNVVIVDSTAVAENYTAEFEEMFGDRQFGDRSPAETPHPQVDVAGMAVENAFSPEDDVQRKILAVLETAQSDIRFMVFTLTDNEISKLLNRKLREGVSIQGVVESRNVGASGADFEVLQQVGMDILQDGNPYMMHHKVLIVDEAIVITGSYNFTRNAAENNDENALIIYSPEIAAQYLEEFQRVYRQAEEAQ